jgi:hypothetical protein
VIAYVLRLIVAYVCVLLGFDERLCAGIDYYMCVICWTFVTDYVLRLIIACVYVFCWNLMKDYVPELIIACVYSAGLL